MKHKTNFLQYEIVQKSDKNLLYFKDDLVITDPNPQPGVIQAAMKTQDGISYKLKDPIPIASAASYNYKGFMPKILKQLKECVTDESKSPEYYRRTFGIRRSLVKSFMENNMKAVTFVPRQWRYTLKTLTFFGNTALKGTSYSRLTALEDFEMYYADIVRPVTPRTDYLVLAENQAHFITPERKVSNSDTTFKAFLEYINAN
jgi:hypothetical protein